MIPHILNWFKLNNDNHLNYTRINFIINMKVHFKVFMEFSIRYKINSLSICFKKKIQTQNSHTSNMWLNFARLPNHIQNLYKINRDEFVTFMSFDIVYIAFHIFRTFKHKRNLYVLNYIGKFLVDLLNW